MPVDVVLLLIVLAAALTAGLTGFGFNLVSVPLLALYLDPRSAVVVSLLLGVVASGMLLLSPDTRALIEGRLTLLLFGFSLLGLPIGVLLFSTVSPNALKVAIGLITLVYGLPLLWSHRFRITAHAYVGAAAGLAGGILASSTGLSGPPAIVFVHAQRLQPARLRATLAAYVFLVTVMSLPLLMVTGSVNQGRVVAALPLIPAVVIGVLIGRALFTKVAAHLFEKLVIAALVVMGLADLVTGLVAIR
jgi:uncharacterized membrane protein YfcA